MTILSKWTPHLLRHTNPLLFVTMSVLHRHSPPYLVCTGCPVLERFLHSEELCTACRHKYRGQFPVPSLHHTEDKKIPAKTLGCWLSSDSAEQWFLCCQIIAGQHHSINMKTLKLNYEIIQIISSCDSIKTYWRVLLYVLYPVVIPSKPFDFIGFVNNKIEIKRKGWYHRYHLSREKGEVIKVSFLICRMSDLVSKSPFLLLKRFSTLFIELNFIIFSRKVWFRS